MLVGTLPFLLHVRMVKLKASYWAKCSSTKGFCFRKLLVWEKIMASPDSNLRSIFCIILLFINKVRQAFKLKCFKWINRHKQTMFTFTCICVLDPLIFHPHDTSSSSCLNLHSDCWSLLTVFRRPSRWSTNSLEVILCRFASFHSSMGVEVSTVFENVALDLFLNSLTLLSLAAAEWPGLLYSAAPDLSRGDESTLWHFERLLLDLCEDFGRGLEDGEVDFFSLPSQSAKWEH